MNNLSSMAPVLRNELARHEEGMVLLNKIDKVVAIRNSKELESEVQLFRIETIMDTNDTCLEWVLENRDVGDINNQDDRKYIFSHMAINLLALYVMDKLQGCETLEFNPETLGAAITNSLELYRRTFYGRPQLVSVA